MNTLHIVRRIDDKLAVEVISQDIEKGTVSVLLIQDGVLSDIHGVDNIYASVDDVEARGIVSNHMLVDYAAICQLIIDHARVIVW